MSQKQLIVLQIMSIASIPFDQLEAFDLGNVRPDDHKTYTNLWTPVPHVQYTPVHLSEASIEAVDIKTMAMWTDDGETVYQSDDKTAIKIRGDWYIVIDEFGDYDWL